MNWTDEERYIIEGSCEYISEVYEDDRKGISQNFYVMEVKEDSEYLCTSTYKYNKVPSNLVGIFKMRHATDLRYISLSEAVWDEEWVRCEQVEVTVIEWRNIDE